MTKIWLEGNTGVLWELWWTLKLLLLITSEWALYFWLQCCHGGQVTRKYEKKCLPIAGLQDIPFCESPQVPPCVHKKKFLKVKNQSWVHSVYFLFTTSATTLALPMRVFQRFCTKYSQVERGWPTKQCDLSLKHIRWGLITYRFAHLNA